MERGDIYIANISPRTGSEQTGTRPVVIISHNSFNHIPNWNSIIVIPVSTSQKQAVRTPTVVFLPKNTAGLDKDSHVLCHQITTLDKSKLQKKVGSLSEEHIKGIEKAISYALDMFS